MKHAVEPMPDALVAPLYSYADADRLAVVSRGTAKRWLTGYARRGPDGEQRVIAPVSQGSAASDGAVSFADLIEIVAIGRFRELGISIRGVRTIVDACRTDFGVDHPLSTLRFKADGRDVFVHSGTDLRSVLRNRGQLAWDEILGPFLETLDYREGFAVRWWPRGRNAGVTIDPEYGFGLPVVEGSGVRTEIVLERVRAGDSPSEIAYDFGITPEQVESALRFEAPQAA